MAREITYLTRKGFEKLQKEFEHLKKVRKPQLSNEIEEAREKGDLRENAEYHAAKEALTHVQRRIAQLTVKLSSAKIIDDEEIPSDKIFIGAKVTLKDIDADEDVKFTAPRILFFGLKSKYLGVVLSSLR